MLTWPGGATTAAPAAWLYDNAADAFDPASGHRLRSALELRAAARVLEARIEDDALVIRFAPLGERRLVMLSALNQRPADRRPEPALWATSGAIEAMLPISFRAFLADDDALAAALGAIVRHGIAFIAGAGQAPRTVEHAVSRFGFIRETNYGRLFDVREEPSPTHLAYTAAGLDLHTDNPYRDPEPTLQLLHAIETSASGGESCFADGFAHAEELRRASPVSFRILAETTVEFAYRAADGARFSARTPIIETCPDGSLKALRVNHRALVSPGPMSGVTEAWYEAYLDLYERLHAPGAVLRRRLAPGDMVIFDNRRVLHGRASYRSTGPSGRWLQGCYADRDGLLATLTRLEARGAAS